MNDNFYHGDTDFKIFTEKIRVNLYNPCLRGNKKLNMKIINI